MKNRFLLPAILLPLLTFLTLSCDSDQEEHNPVVYNIVELASRGDEGTVFNYYPAPGDVPVALTARTKTATSVEPGDCLFLGYTEQKAVSPSEMEISVKSMAPVLNADARIASADELRGWDAEPIHLLALWRAGEKVILRCLLTADSTPRYFGLLIDAATLSDPVPTAYIYHRRDTPTPNYTSQYYTAFSLAPLLHPSAATPASSETNITPSASIPAYTALRICLANSANPSLTEILLPL